jgi:arylsulfatase
VYAQPSCTPGRAALITGQYPIRLGLTSIWAAGRKWSFNWRPNTENAKTLGLQNCLGPGKWHAWELETVRFLLPHGLMNLRFWHHNLSKCPSRQGFPEINASRPRNILIHSWATNKDRLRRSQMGESRNAGWRCQLTRLKMETIDEDFLAMSRRLVGKVTKWALWF